MRNLIFILFIIANYHIIGSNAKNERKDFIKVLSKCVDFCAQNLNCTEWNDCAYHYPDVCAGIQKECPQRSLKFDFPDSNAKVALQVITYVTAVSTICFIFCYLCYLCDAKWYKPNKTEDESDYTHDLSWETEKIVIISTREDLARILLSDEEIGQFGNYGDKLSTSYKTDIV